MDTSNWRPTEGGSGDSSMESSDWRAQLQADSRKKMVNRIMDALKSHVQVSGYEGRQEVEKMAVSFEENVYVAATSQSEYTRKICFKILTIETRSQNPNTSYPAIVDWRLPADSRQRIVNKIMDTLKRHVSFSGPESLQELKKIAVRFEDKVYSAATSQSDYLRTLSLKMLKVETIYLKNPLADTNRAINPSYPDSTIGEEWQKEVYEKIKALKDLYLPDLNDMHQKIVRKLQQHGALPQQLPNERIEKLKIFKNMLERFMAFLQISKHNILPIFKEKLSTYEKQIVIIATSNRQKLHQPPPQ